jgi:uncharacterized protein with beta-barrel porin domain
MQLDPVMVSVGYQQSFGFVQKVTAAGRNRMFNRMNQYYPGMLMQMNPGGQYLGQEPGDHRSMERLLAELADEPVAASPYLHPPVPGVLPPHGMATPHEVITAGGGVSNLWGEIFGGGQIQETTRLVKGWKNSSGGFAVGRDRLLPMYHALIGFSFGAGFDSARSEDKNNRAESEQMFFSFYGSKKWRNWLLTGSFGYSHAELESTRYALNNGQARGIRNAGTWFGNLEAARRCELIHRRGGASYFEPYISWELISYEENAFTESGNYIAMAFDRRNESTGLSTVGFRLGSLIPECWGLRCMKPELSFGWIHDFNGGPSQMTAKWAAGGSVPMLLYGTPRHGDRIAGGIKFEADVSRRLTMFFRYDGEYAKNYGGHYVSSGVNVMF